MLLLVLLVLPRKPHGAACITMALSWFWCHVKKETQTAWGKKLKKALLAVDTHSLFVSSCLVFSFFRRHVIKHQRLFRFYEAIFWLRGRCVIRGDEVSGQVKQPRKSQQKATRWNGIWQRQRLLHWLLSLLWVREKKKVPFHSGPQQLELGWRWEEAPLKCAGTRTRITSSGLRLAQPTPRTSFCVSLFFSLLLFSFCVILLFSLLFTFPMLLFLCFFFSPFSPKMSQVGAVWDASF